jgi:hypothetical protein
VADLLSHPGKKDLVRNGGILVDNPDDSAHPNVPASASLEIGRFDPLRTWVSSLPDQTGLLISTGR